MLCQQTKQGEMIESTFIMKIIHIKNRRIADIELAQGHWETVSIIMFVLRNGVLDR